MKWACIRAERKDMVHAEDTLSAVFYWSVLSWTLVVNVACSCVVGRVVAVVVMEVVGRAV